jgi:hypothetical protein
MRFFSAAALTAVLLWSMSACYRDTAVPLSPIVASIVTEDNGDILPKSREASGNLGDYTLFNNYVQLVIQGNGWHPGASLYEPYTGGAIVDLSTRTTGINREQVTRNDDGLLLLRQGLNLSQTLLIDYTSIQVFVEERDRAGFVLKGRVIDLAGELSMQGAAVDASGVVQQLTVETQMELLASESTEDTTNQAVRHFTLTTVVHNQSGQALPIFTIHDSMLLPKDAYDTFIPHPGWAYGKPESGGKAFPFYVQSTSRQSASASYAWINPLDFYFSADRTQDPWGERIMIGKFFSPNQLLAAGESLTFHRLLLVQDSSVSSEAFFTTLVNELKNRSDNLQFYTEQGTLGLAYDSNNAPTAGLTIAHISPPAQFFDGTQWQFASETFPLPLWGSGKAPGVVSIPTPPGQLLLEGRTANSDAEIRLVTTENRVNEYGVESEVDSLILLSSEEVKNLGNLVFGDGHALFTAEVNDGENRKLLHRISVLSPLGPALQLGQAPSNQEGPFSVNTDFEHSLKLPPGTHELVFSHGPLYLANLQSVSVDTFTSVNEYGDAQEEFTAEPASLDLSLTQVIDWPSQFCADFGLVSGGFNRALNDPTLTVSLAEAEDLDVFFFADSYKITDAPTFLAGKSSLLGSLLDDEDVSGDSDELLDRMVGAYAYTSGSAPRPSAPWGLGEYSVFHFSKEELVDLPPRLMDSPAAFFEEVRELFPQSLILLRNPRRTTVPVGAFNVFQETLTPSEPISSDHPALNLSSPSGATRNSDFDLLQILEGNRYQEFLQTRLDWFHWLNQGVYKPIVGGSEPGSLGSLSIGTVRSYFRVPDATRRDNDLEAFWSAVKAGQGFVTNGPLLEASLGNGQFGDSGSGTTLNLSVHATYWVPVEEIRLIIDGQEVATFTPEMTELVRFSETLDLTQWAGSGAHWLVIEAGASLATLQRMSQPEFAADFGTFSKIYPGHAPLAVSNPIFFTIP